MPQEELNTLSQEWAGSIYPPAAYQAGFRKALELVRAHIREVGDNEFNLKQHQVLEPFEDLIK